MNEIPARGLPPRMYLPIVAAIMALCAIPIALFLRSGFGTNGSALGPGGTQLAPPPMIAQALSELRARIAHNPRDLDALTSLAGLELEANHLETAAQLDAQAVTVAPRDANVRARYAEVLNNLGQSAKARAQLDTLLKLEPGNPDALYERGIIDERLGEHVAASADFDAFLRRAKANDPRRAALLGQSGAR